MSLAIKTDKIEKVLLADGVWYPVKKGTFYIDSYEFIEEYEDGSIYTVLGGGQSSHVPAIGVAFISTRERKYSCPINEVKAVIESIKN